VGFNQVLYTVEDRKIAEEEIKNLRKSNFVIKKEDLFSLNHELTKY
jgi:hypothetical protein